MANIKELRGRIKSIGGIAKITKAMEMVASMKLRKVQNRALAARPYTEELRGMMGHLAGFVGDNADRPLFQRREVKTTGILLISSDRGLCGAYNANITAKIKTVEEEIRAEGKEPDLRFWVIGRKGYTWLGRRGYKVERFHVEPGLEDLDFNAAKILARELVENFLSGELDEVKLLYTAFMSAGRFQARAAQFLPVTEELAAPEDREANEKYYHDYLLEPSRAVIFDRVVPRYLETVVFDSMLESLASEMASRRMAMKGATDAASRMGKELKKKYNRARQESITMELLDIVGGTSAVS